MLWPKPVRGAGGHLFLARHGARFVCSGDRHDGHVCVAVVTAGATCPATTGGEHEASPDAPRHRCRSSLERRIMRASDQRLGINAAGHIGARDPQNATQSLRRQQRLVSSARARRDHGCVSFNATAGPACTRTRVGGARIREPSGTSAVPSRSNYRAVPLTSPSVRSVCRARQRGIGTETKGLSAWRVIRSGWKTNSTTRSSSRRRISSLETSRWVTAPTLAGAPRRIALIRINSGMRCPGGRSRPPSGWSSPQG